MPTVFADRERTSPRRPILLAGCLLAALLALLLLIFPTAILGVHSGPLSQSTGASSAFQCREVPDHWTCPVWVGDVSDTINYRVEVDFFGCWEGERAGGEEARLPPVRISGCVTSIDYLASLIL